MTYGPVNCDLDGLIATIRSLPAEAWTPRGDPESDRTTAIRDSSDVFPSAQAEEMIEQARQQYLGPGYANRVVLSCVPAGQQILPHTDDFGSHVRANSQHCHIPLITDEQIIMGFEDTQEHLQAGYLYAMDETLMHYVLNPSRVDRVHLLFAHWPH